MNLFRLGGPNHGVSGKFIPKNQINKLIYNPALDGIRAFAVLFVLLFHARVPGFEGGYLGVDIFLCSVDF